MSVSVSISGMGRQTLAFMTVSISRDTVRRQASGLVSSRVMLVQVLEGGSLVSVSVTGVGR